nr:probable LRR receptor-like serine/threonine-protein kinase At4g36180 [Ipomoea batatas]GME18067.1 probable LRR receptor-like serine/threonine-protein kinase At4g36180 [Ipomoea batatas]
MVSFFTSRFEIVLISVQLLFLHVHSTTHWQDVEVLKQLKNSVDPTSITPGSCLASWDFSLDPCYNLFTGNFTCGFRCDVVVSSLSRVTELALDHWGYSGSLTSVSWNLPYLQTLDLTGNSFHGSIPDSLSHLLNLRRISLSRNLFSGPIPASLGSLSGLEELYLDYNNLEGTVPASINRLNNLKRLDLQGNKLAGELPQLPGLNTLYFLDVSNNRISGELPDKLPASLVQLSMRNNTVEGNIPTSVTALLSVQVLDLSHNKLSGSIPAPLFTHPSLQQVTLSHNQFGSIDEPAAGKLFHDSQLIAVDLSNNDIRGFLPGFLGLMPRLSSLSLENNKLSGIIPTQYAMKVMEAGEGVSRLERLLLGSNYLSGAIPGPLLGLKPGSVKVRLGDNCLYRCPLRLFLCEGGKQKSLTDCKALGHAIP